MSLEAVVGKVPSTVTAATVTLRIESDDETAPRGVEIAFHRLRSSIKKVRARNETTSTLYVAILAWRFF